MSVSEILEELPRLSDGDRQAILRRLIQIDSGVEIDESPEMLTAIDEGVRSMDSGPGVSLDDARRRLAGWTSK